MDESNFHELADAQLETIEEALENADEEGLLDVELSEGVLTISFPEEDGEFVINKHGPSRQIWVASPLSGASHFHYDVDVNDWVEADEERGLLEFLAAELDELTGISIET